MNAVAPGGCIFLGDVRNLQLLEAFYASVELHKAPTDLSVTQWQQRVHRQIAQENELLIDPAFFRALQQRFSQITDVQIHLQRGQHHNELNQFRYNVILYVGNKIDIPHVGNKIDIPQDFQSLDWHKQQLTLPTLREQLVKTKSGLLSITGIPNARLLKPLKSAQLLKNTQELQTVSQLLELINAIDPELGVEPNDLSVLAEALSYSLVVTGSDVGDLEYYNAIFIQHQTQEQVSWRIPTLTQGQTKLGRDWQSYANQPLQAQLNRKLIPQLRSHLEVYLPEYMMPNAFIMLDNIPLTANGKIDRRALPSPEQIRLDLAETFVPPSTPVEEMLAQIWTEVLDIEQVSIHDNFFELGGDSIRGIQVIAKAKQIGFDFSLSQLLQHQTIRELASLVSRELSPLATQKTEAFSLISEEERLTLPKGVEDAYPLTALQLGMIFHSEYQSNVSLYHDVFSYHIRATLNLQALHSAIKQVVNRHEVLRTSFALTGYEEPLQLVHEQVDIPLHSDDWSHLSTTEQELALDKWIEQEKTQYFDWNIPPLIRFQVHRRSSETFNLTLSFHHSILDGWSEASLITELLQQYLHLLRKNTPPLQETPTLKFRDFVALEQITLQSQECKKYWSRQLNDITINKIPRWSELYNATDKGDLLIPISSQVSQDLKQLSKVAGVPLKSVLLAAHFRVLSLLTNQTDLLTGLVSNGRLEEMDGERTLGLFLNTLPLRLQLQGDTWIDLVRRTFDSERQSLPWRRYPLAILQKTFGGQPLFETVFNFINFHVYQNIIEAEDLEVLEGKFFNQTDLALVANFSLHPISKEIELILKYDVHQLGKQQIKKIGSYYQKTLRVMASQRSEFYGQHCLLSDEEEHQLITEWNNTQIAYPDKCIHQIFEEQVERNPEGTAVIFEGQKLTYKQLNERANRLAHYLQEKGVKPEVLVGIFIERSLDMIVGILGILKAGGAYVPIDSSYPEERLAYILSDSAVSILLTQESLGKSLPENQAELICLDRDWLTIGNYSQQNPINQVKPDNLAYVIYTSGSTGKPKGVMSIHRGICNHILRIIDTYPLTPEENTLQLAPFGFDASVFEVCLAFISGTTLTLIKPEGHKDIAYLTDVIAQSKITQILFVPSMLRVFLEQPNLENCYCLKRVFCGGEVLSYELMKRFLERLNCELYNLYGPTEAAVYSTEWKYEAQCNYQVIPIGRPIANTQTYILDSHLQPVPIGTTGELHIGGVGLARGYLNRPELTAQKFIDNPFGEGKLYKTGDLARYLPDGNIEYLGRIDNQVKLRGIRIELGEIEAVLENHSQVEQAVVITEKDPANNQILVAYVVRKDQSLIPSELGSFLKQKLPSYMIPSAFVMLSDLPLNPNGKIDRKYLPKPDESLIVETPYLAPRNSSEIVLVNIWQQLLQISKIGINDNFFDLGGHSLQAMNLMALIHQELEIEIPLSMIYEKPTITELSKYIIYTQQMNIQPKGRPYVVFNQQYKKAVFLFPPALGFAAAYANLADRLTDYAIYTFRYIADAETLEKYAELIDSLATNQDIKLMGHSAGGFLAMLIAQKLEARGRVVSDIILLDTYRGGRESQVADMSEIKAGVDTFLLNPKRQELRRYFLEDQKLRDRTYNQVWEYFNFLWYSDIENLRTNGNIYLIRAEENHEREDDWIQATTNQLINHYAYGAHHEMINPPYLNQNATIINSILMGMSSGVA